jgi:predicted O-methyltransferase YrrM
MQHIYQDLPGWFDFPDLYAEQVARARRGAHFVETGVYMGKSTAFLAVTAANAGKDITVDAYDVFLGIPEAQWTGLVCPGDFTYADQEAARSEDGTLEASVRANLAPVSSAVNLYREDGVKAASRYEDGSLDFVFLDDDHSGPHVLAELEAWWPKIRPGGTLAGHDYDWPGVKDAVKRWGTRVGRPANGVSQRCWAIQKPAPAASWLVPPKRRRCLVAVCCNERNVPRHAAESLARIGWGQRVTDAATRHEFQAVDFAWFSRYLSVADLRDEAALVALAGDYSHILFLDADMVWPTDVLDRMLAHHQRGIVTGLYHLKAWPHWPVALKSATFNPLEGQYDYRYDEGARAGDGLLRPEQLVGMGCTLVPVEVFRRFERPWFAYQVNGEGTSTVTEDVWFCQQAAKLGCPIWLDPSVDCGHVSQQPVTGAWFDRATYEMQMLSAGQRMARRSPE